MEDRGVLGVGGSKENQWKGRHLKVLEERGSRFSSSKQPGGW